MTARAWRAGLALSLLAAAAAAEDKTVARPLLVTVDDLPIGGSGHDAPDERARITRGLLEALARHGIKAVALVTWGNVHSEADLGLLDSWLKAGHELGNHTDRHLSYTSTPIPAYLADVEGARARLAAFLEARGRTLRFFRFPFLREGDTDEKLDAMRAWLERTGQRNLPVTIDDQDWSFDKPWSEARRAGDAKGIDGWRPTTRPHCASPFAITRRKATGSSAGRCRRSCCCMPTQWGARNGTRCSRGWRRPATASPPRTKSWRTRRSPSPIASWPLTASGYGTGSRMAAARRRSGGT